MRELKLRQPVLHEQVDCYRFKFDPYSWLHLYIDEGSGELHIDSDWGFYSHTWCGQIGTLHSFLFKHPNWNYVIDKLLYNDERKKYEIYKAKETVEELKKLIFEATYEDPEEPEDWDSETRDAMEWLESFENDYDTVEGACTALLHCDYFNEWDPPTYLHCVVTGLHPRILFLRDHLLPFCREELIKAGKLEKYGITSDRLPNEDAQEAVSL